MSLTILTLNILHDHADWEARRACIGEWLDRLDPDVVGLQEVLRGADGDQCSELLADRGYHCAYGRANRFWRDPDLDFGNGLACRWPLRDEERIELPHAREDDGAEELRCALGVVAETPFGPLPLTCTHLNWRFDHGYVRERQVVALCDFVRRRAAPEALPPVVLGDFNAAPDSCEIRYVTGLQSIDGRSAHLRDAWELAGDGSAGHTWSHRNPMTRPWLEPDRRIDYVFVGPPRRDGVGRVESCRLVCDAPSGDVWPSDHFGLCVEMRSEPDPALAS